jgi:hypothetical protein
VQTSVLYPAVKDLSAYAGIARDLPESEMIPRSELAQPRVTTG